MLDRLRQLFTTKGQLASPPPALLEALGAWPASGIAVSAERALTVPAVSAAVRAIAEAVACLPVGVYRVDPDGSRSPAPSHPAHQLLAGTWNEWTGSYDGLLATTIDALCCDAGGLVWINRVDGRPRELVRYRPGSWTVDYDRATAEPTFRFSGAGGGSQILPAADVIHVRAFGAVGRAPLTLAREAIGLALAMEAYATRLFSRGARPSGVLKVPARLSEQAVGRIKAAWQAAHGGETSGGTAILEESCEWQALAFNSVDSQFLELRQFAVTEIARAFRVPPSMLYDLSRATWSNMEQMSREFLVFSLQPMLRAWDSALNRTLLTADERREFVIGFETDDLTQANLGDRAVAYSSLISSRVINPNEARRWENLPPYAGGDEFTNPNVMSGKDPAPSDAGAAP